MHLADLDARRKFIYDNVNIPAMLDYLAAITLVLDNDHVAKNYYLYCDTNDGANSVYDYANPKGTNEWAMVPWDKDLTFGKDYVFTDYQISGSLRASVFRRFGSSESRRSRTIG